MTSSVRPVVIVTCGVLAALAGSESASALVSKAWLDPGWTYEYTGDAAGPGAGQDAALDGSWNHDNGSDSWDESTIGAGAPGGLSSLTDGDVGYVRIQDPGDPRDYNMPDNSNRKIYLTHNIGNEGASATILNDGVTLSFRARVSTGGLLDNAHPDGGGGIVPWASGGDGYGIHDGGKGLFTIKQGSGANGAIGFSLAMPILDAESGTTGGLLMNHLNGTAVSGTVDTGEAGTVNRLDLADPTAWHEFWITIVADTSGGGSHRADIYVDGSLAPSVFHVTAGSGNDEGYSYLGLGMGSTGFVGAVDVDFFAWKAGVVIPQSVLACASAVTPTGTTAFETDINQQPATATANFTVLNGGNQALNYTAAELDANQQPANVPWLSLGKTFGSAPAGGSDQLTINVDATGLPDGVHTAFVRFTDNCTPPTSHIRQVDLEVIGCRWSVDSCNALRGFLGDYPEAPIDDIIYTITNDAATTVDYDVSISYPDPTCAGWLAMVDGNGMLQPNESGQVTATFDEAALAACAADASYDAILTFSDSCSHQETTRTVTVRAVPAGTTHVWSYLGDVDPLAPNSAGPGLSFRLFEGVLQGAVLTDTGADDQFAWDLPDLDVAPNGKKTKLNSCVFDGATCVDAPLYNEVGATVVSRLKVPSVPDVRELVLGIYDTAGLYSSLSWSGPDGIVRETRRGVESTVPGNTGYVTLRMTAVGIGTAGYTCAREIKVYLDEQPTPVLELLAAGGSSSADTEGIGFGAGSTDGTIHVTFDWVSGTNAGAFAPGAEMAVLGRSLIPSACPDPFADTDGDGDVDQSDFATWQTCLTGPGVPMPDPAVCACLDTDDDDMVDADDLVSFNRCASGPDLAADPGCDDPAGE